MTINNKLKYLFLDSLNNITLKKLIFVVILCFVNFISFNLIWLFA